MEAQHSDGIGMPVSVWTSVIKSQDGSKCIVVIEPVQKIAANVTVSHRVWLSFRGFSRLLYPIISISLVSVWKPHNVSMMTLLS